MSNFETPTDIQMEQLKKSGILPYSSFLTASFIAVVVSLCVFFYFDNFFSLFQELNSFDDFAEKGNQIFRLLILPPAAVLVSSLLFILFQRKFYLSLSFLYPSSRKKVKFSLSYRFIFSLIKSIFLLVFLLILAYITFYFLFPFYFKVLTGSGEDVLVIFLSALKSFLPIFIVVELCLLLFWFVVYKLLFLFSIVVNKDKVLGK